MSLPQRILVLGPSGAGKSTLARRIGERSGLSVVHLDALYWMPGWRPSETESFRARMAAAAAGERWVIDGNYGSHLDLRLPRADAIIWLDLPRRVYFPRAVWRSIRHYGRERSDIGAGCREQFDWSFFKDWVWTYPARSRGKHATLMKNLPAGMRGIILRSRAEVARFTDGLPRSLDGISE
ncbi:topology modulation protein [Bradyrhizobium sp. CCGUVB1N3]|uniref:topology modulation protein n=1 Tax=Bradyrhizobium sp. CCGUVB1N3 TaxID=2949629 RepID=UPI0020B1A983|nr:topology modulation protein [Bradyrhizobium sp. CCGUVB1N3]MCP3470164.1 topology modulation protein [Bradyrhizobium sp. CCGUVB1N3]